MSGHKLTAALAATFATLVFGRAPMYSQCGGQGWTGATSCVAGACCTASNQYYSQCLPGSCGSPGTTTLVTTTSQPSNTTSIKAIAPGTYTNPVLWEDLADLDVFRVGSVWYYSASTMAYSPGAPILRSYDLVNWEYIGHSVPTLSWSTKYNLANGERAYVKGICPFSGVFHSKGSGPGIFQTRDNKTDTRDARILGASTMRYRSSNNKWYWIGCIEFGRTYVYTAPAVTGPWSLSATLATCFYDAGLFIDDNDTMYVAYGNTQLSVAQLSADGLSTSRTQQIYATPASIGTLEGSRMYKRNGQYYILVTRPANAEYVLKASNPFGPYTIKVLANNAAPSVPGDGYPHQGGLVDTPDGSWYYMAFEDSYPGGRIPVLAPVTWGSDGFPVLTLSGGGWGKTYPMPMPAHPLPPTTGTDSFTGTSLGHAWEWNHNPDTTRFAVNNGLTLRTATVTVDLYAARNTLTHRIHGPISTATIILDTTNMADGDRAGLSLFRDQSAWIGVKNDGGTFTVGMTNGLRLDTTSWATTSTGTAVASAAATRGRIWLRCTANVNPGTGRTGTFSYSRDGTTYTTLGPAFAMTNDWHYFIGYRWGIFNYATKALGGSVLVSSFTQN